MEFRLADFLFFSLRLAQQVSLNSQLQTNSWTWINMHGCTYLPTPHKICVTHPSSCWLASGNLEGKFRGNNYQKLRWHYRNKIYHLNCSGAMFKFAFIIYSFEVKKCHYGTDCKFNLLNLYTGKVNAQFLYFKNVFLLWQSLYQSHGVVRSYCALYAPVPNSFYLLQFLHFSRFNWYRQRRQAIKQAAFLQITIVRYSKTTRKV